MERRCPTCGGLVGPDATWCGQCWTRLDVAATRGVPPAREVGPEGVEVPEVEPVAAPRSAGGDAGPASDAAIPSTEEGPAPRARRSRFRRRAEGLVWTCPQCDLENPLEAEACTRCGTPFRTLFEEQDRAVSVPAGRATTLSLLFPGLGHMALGRGAEGLARAVVFLWVLGMVLAIVVVRKGLGAGPFLPLILVLILSAAALYATTALDAGRIAEGQRPMVTPRILLYGVAALMLLTVGVLLASAMRAAGP